MAEDSAQDKDLQATPEKRRKAREQGQVALSREVTAAVTLTAVLLAGSSLLSGALEHLQALLGDSLARCADPSLTTAQAIELLSNTCGGYVRIVGPFLLLCAVAGVVSCVAQVGFMVTWQPLMPNWGRLDPIAGAARFVSARSAMEVAKACLKVSLLVSVTWNTLQDRLWSTMELLGADPSVLPNFLGEAAFALLSRACLVLGVLAGIDYGFARWELERKLKMSKEEQKQEHKEHEGDPHIKARVRQVQQEMARQRMFEDLKKADVVITNPTHLAVAIRFEDKVGIPRIVAKGADHLAARIREAARAAGVPLVENKPVARALYKVKLGQTIPPELFDAVAKILTEIAQMNMRAGAAAPEWMRQRP